MRFVSSVRGIAAVHGAADDVMPLAGLVQEELIRIIAEDYHFSVKPQGAQVGSILGFASGWFDGKQGKLPIIQLLVVPNGDVISAATTEIADQIMDDYLA